MPSNIRLPADSFRREHARTARSTMLPISQLPASSRPATCARVRTPAPGAVLSARAGQADLRFRRAPGRRVEPRRRGTRSSADEFNLIAGALERGRRFIDLSSKVILMLTNATVKAAQPGARPYKLHDSGGLHLLVRPTGSKTFRMKYRRRGREQLLTIGSWPEIQLGDARARRDQAREQLDRNVDIKVNRAPAEHLDVRAARQALARAAIAAVVGRACGRRPRQPRARRVPGDRRQGSALDRRPGGARAAAEGRGARQDRDGQAAARADQRRVPVRHPIANLQCGPGRSDQRRAQPAAGPGPAAGDHRVNECGACSPTSTR
jgi:hypothetical protein